MKRRFDALASAFPFLLAALAAGCSAKAPGLSTEGASEWSLGLTAGASTCSEDGRYVVIADVVVDTANDGRVWERGVPPILFTHDDAAAYCVGLALDGHGEWRLPTVVELNTLKLNPPGIKDPPGSCSPSIDQSAFPDTPAADFWTATTRPAGDAIYVGFDDGRDHPATLDTPMNVRCVSTTP